LGIGYLQPLAADWRYEKNEKVDMTPWRYALPTSIILAAGIVVTYLLFSSIGLVGGVGPEFYWALLGVISVTAVLCWLSIARWRARYAAGLANVG